MLEFKRVCFCWKVSSEREQFQAQMKMEADRSTAKADQLRLSSNLENEVANKKRIQTEVSEIFHFLFFLSYRLMFSSCVPCCNHMVGTIVIRENYNPC